MNQEQTRWEINKNKISDWEIRNRLENTERYIQNKENEKKMNNEFMSGFIYGIGITIVVGGIVFCIKMVI